MRARVGRDYREELARLRARIAALSSRLSRTNSLAVSADTMAQQSAKRFRIGVASVPLTLLGSPITVTYKWSEPLPTDSYRVDASCSAMPGTQWPYTITNQTAAGCTVTFSAPILIAAGSIVVVIAVSPAS